MNEIEFFQAFAKHLIIAMQLGFKKKYLLERLRDFVCPFQPCPQNCPELCDRDKYVEAHCPLVRSSLYIDASNFYEQLSWADPDNINVSELLQSAMIQLVKEYY